MASRIEDYGLIGDLEGAALVSKDGSIDWCCLPRFDSPACFASLIGTEDNGYWRIRPQGDFRTSRRYLPGSLVLETRFDTSSGSAIVLDCMPVREEAENTSIVRIVKGVSGRVDLRMELAIRFDYGRTVPWVRRTGSGLTALSGPQALELFTPVPLENKDFRTTADFSVSAGESVPFALAYGNSLDPPRPPDDAPKLCDDTIAWWQSWGEGCTYAGPWREQMVRSLITLKALTHRRSGGIVAAPTTSLPELIGGARNWDYRFCWLRDATFALYSLLCSGMHEEASQWREWLLRVAAGMPSQLQTIYGPTGERLLPEFEIDWLSGYEGSVPVRVGNQAHRQLQLDVYGELMDVFHVSRRVGIKDSDDSWALQKALVDFLESGWRKADNGIWEVRGPRRHFTHSKVMCWVGIDRAVKAIERHGLDGDLTKWKRLRAKMHDDICSLGFDSERNSFTQSYRSKSLDASLLMLPLVGFLPPEDPRIAGTLKAIESELMHEGFVRRYTPDKSVDGLAGSEGVFLPCTFWLADNYVMAGRHEKATEVFESLLNVSNDLGLLSEEYDPITKRHLGNFPQAFSHVSLINTAHNLTTVKPAADRANSHPKSKLKHASDADKPKRARRASSRSKKASG